MFVPLYVPARIAPNEIEKDTGFVPTYQFERGSHARLRDKTDNCIQAEDLLTEHYTALNMSTEKKMHQVTIL